MGLARPTTPFWARSGAARRRRAFLIYSAGGALDVFASALEGGDAKTVWGGSRPLGAEWLEEGTDAKLPGIAAALEWATSPPRGDPPAPGQYAANTGIFAAKEPEGDSAPKWAEPNEKNYASNKLIYTSKKRRDASAQSGALPAQTRDASSTVYFAAK